VIELVVAPVFHENVAPGAPAAVNTEFPQLSITDTEGAEGVPLTVKTAALEFTLPEMFVHTARYCLLLSTIAVVNDNVPDVAPPMLFQIVPSVLTCHCTVGAGLPLAAELKLALNPEHLVCETGCVVTDGDTALALTVTTTFWELVQELAVNVYT